MVTQFAYTVSRKLLFYSVIYIFFYILQFLRYTKLVDLFTVTIFLTIVNEM